MVTYIALEVVSSLIIIAQVRSFKQVSAFQALQEVSCL
jgi:hypothetical protein